MHIKNILKQIKNYCVPAPLEGADWIMVSGTMRGDPAP